MNPTSTPRQSKEDDADIIVGIGERALNNGTVVPQGRDTSLAILPRPVLKIDTGGAITGLNGEGTQLARTLEMPEAEPGLEQLRMHAGTAAASGETVIESISWTERRQTRWMETTIIPIGDGSAFVIGRDTTLEVNMRLALVDSRQRFKDLVEISSDFAWETDADGAFTFVSPQGALGYSAERLVGMTARDLLYHPTEMPRPFVFETRETVADAELWLRSEDGGAVCVLSSAQPIFGQSGERTGARGVCRDITDERLRQNDLARLKIREQVIAYIVDAVRNEARPADMLSTAVTSIGRAITDTACAVFQHDDADDLQMVADYGELPDSGELATAIGRICTDFVPHETLVAERPTLMMATHYRSDMNGAVALCRKSDAPWSAHDRSLLDAVAAQLGIALRQIENQKELERLSRTDALTGLYNRRAFKDELERAILRSRRNRFQGAVFFVDLNNFKAVNDTHGHDVGDRVLKTLAEILRGAARSYDFVARLGGDEFALWFENIDRQAARRRAVEILRNSRHLEEFNGTSDKRLGLSIGIALDHPDSAESSDDLLKRADAAMYRAKHSRKQHISIARDRTPRKSTP